MKNRHFGFDIIIGLFLICVFAVCQFYVLAAGAGIYKDVSAVMEEQYGERNALGYISTKLHQSDAKGMVSLGRLGDVEAIIIREEMDCFAYNTFIYCHEGYICELFCPATERLTPSDGLLVIAAEELGFSLDGGLLRVDCKTTAGDDTIYIALRSLGGAWS
jgi:hypothetical protein